MKRTSPGSSLLLSATLLLAACGGGSSSGAGAGGGGGGAALQVTRGAITEQAAGSVKVNGVVLDTRGATVRIEKARGSEAELHEGMIVTVHGTFDDRTGAAAEIEFEDAVKGRVDGKSGDVLSVGGQTVRVDDTTHFEDDAARLGSVSAGDRVRVSAVPDDRGGLRATRIDRLAGASEDLEVKGFVSGLSASGFALKVSPDAPDSLAVTYASGVTAPAGLADGSYVEVRAAGPAVAGAIVATSIELEDRFGEAAEVELEGIVTSGGPADFVVDGQRVTTGGSTRWQLGVPGDLVAGVKVEVEGHLDASGVLAADRVSFRAVVRLQGPVSAVAVTGLSSRTFTLLGLPVSVPDAADWRVSPSALVDGAVVELRGNPGIGGASVVGTRIESRNDTRVFVQGAVSAKDEAAGTLTVLGLTVDASGAEFRDPSEVALARAAFFAAVEPGRTVVKARGRSAAALSGSTLTAEEIELEGDE